MTETSETTGTEDAAAEGDWAAALEEQAAAGGDGAPAQGAAETAAAQPAVDRAQFEELDPEPAAPRDGDANLDVVLDIPVTISMEIGRTRIQIRNLLQLNQGSVVELDRIAGEPMDVLVNGTLIAHGEVVVVNEKLGIRLTDVISPSERIRKLR